MADGTTPQSHWVMPATSTRLILLTVCSPGTTTVSMSPVPWMLAMGTNDVYPFTGVSVSWYVARSEPSSSGMFVNVYVQSGADAVVLKM